MPNLTRSLEFGSKPPDWRIGRFILNLTIALTIREPLHKVMGGHLGRKKSAFFVVNLRNGVTITWDLRLKSAHFSSQLRLAQTLAEVP